MPLKRKSPLKRRTPLSRQSKPLKRTRLAKVSKKRKSESKDYEVLRYWFLKGNPVCQCKTCLHPSQSVHHKARRGKFFLRTDTWMAVCNSCHDYIEKHGDWARERGYILTPEQRRKLA